MEPNSVKVHEKEFDIFIKSNSIQKRVEELSRQITKDLSESKPVFLCVLNGAFFFASDLMKNIHFDFEISFVKIASYQGTNSLGEVRMLIGLDENLKGRHVVIIEDIVDTGLSMYELVNDLQKSEPLSIRIASLLLKKEICRYELPLSYIGFEVPNKFLIGYGLDYNKLGRHYHNIYAAADEN